MVLVKQTGNVRPASTFPATEEDDQKLKMKLDEGEVEEESEDDNQTNEADKAKTEIEVSAGKEMEDLDESEEVRDYINQQDEHVDEKALHRDLSTLLYQDEMED